METRRLNNGPMTRNSDPGRIDAVHEPEDHTREESSRTLLYLLARTGRLVRSMQDELLAPFELGATDYAILSRVRYEGPQSTAELARQLRLTSQGVGQAVGKLEKRGLVEREQSLADRRVQLLTLTAAGDALVRSCTHELQTVEEAVNADLTDRETKMLSILLEGALTNLNRALGLDE